MTRTSAASPARGGRRSAASSRRSTSRPPLARKTSPRYRSSNAMRTSGILTIGGAFVALLGGVFSLLMMKAFLVDTGQGFVDLTGLVVGGVVLAIGLVLIGMGRKRARVEVENDERNFTDLALAIAKKNSGQ